MSGPPRIRVTVDRLVLGGFDARQGPAIARALQTALRAALAAPGGSAALGTGRSLASMRLPALRFGASPSPADVGGRAARAIAKGIGS